MLRTRSCLGSHVGCRRISGKLIVVIHIIAVDLALAVAENSGPTSESSRARQRKLRALTGRTGTGAPVPARPMLPPPPITSFPHQRRPSTAPVGPYGKLLTASDQGSTHFPLSAGFKLHTLLAIARLTCVAQSSLTPAGSAVVHFAPIAAAAEPA